MNLKGVVSSVHDSGVRVTFPDRSNVVSPIIKIAAHVGSLKVDDSVAVMFFSNSMADGLVVAKF